MPRRSVTPAQAGSAYLLALLVLVVLTMIGLGLAFATQSEMLLGSNQRLVDGAFYAAESGLSIAVARVLVLGDHRPVDVALEHPRPTTITADGTEKPLGVPLRQRITTTPFHPILALPCHLCEAGNEGTYGQPGWQRVHHAVTVRAAIVGALEQEIAASTVSATIVLEPAAPKADALASIDDPDTLAGILH